MVNKRIKYIYIGIDNYRYIGYNIYSEIDQANKIYLYNI